MREKLKNKLTQEYLKECLHYDPETGIFNWKERPAHHFKDSLKQKFQTKEVKCKAWNKKHSNKTVGHKNKQGYIEIIFNNKYYKAHRLAFLYTEGYLPEHDVDHIDRNRSNNKWNNLRHATRRCNMQNRNVSKNNKTGITGIHWYKTFNKWCVTLTINRNTKHLGYYINFDDAVKARYNEEQNNINWTCSVESSAYKYLKESSLLLEEL